MYAYHQKIVFSSILLLLMTINSAVAMDLFVSPSGNDSNPGTKESPLASLTAARDKARQFAAKQPVTVHFADGVYYLPETLVFAPEDSGSAENTVVYKSESEGGAILSGGSALKLAWEPHENGIFKARTPADLTIDQVFVDGTNQRMARYPNFDPAKKAEPYQGNAADAFSKERAAKWSDPTGAYMHVMHRSQWGGYQYRITGKDENGELTYEGGWQNNRPGPMHKQFRMVEHVFEELDAPGEWFHDQKTSMLYYMPEAGLDLNEAKVEVVRLRHLVDFQGTESKPVKFISLQGFTVRHAARTFMDTKEQMVRSDWTIYRGGAVMLSGTEDVSISDCEFDQVGGNAIFVNNYNRRTKVNGCHIHDVGASGVCFVGDPNALRDPLFRYGEKNDLAKIDRTPGPQTNNYPADGSVEDCLIHGIGTVERQTAGVQIEMAAEITVSDCSIYDTSRAGINIGDGAFGGHLIQRCDVFDTVLETHDHGSFNSWGRDRYWRSDHLKATQEAVDADPKLPFLDAIKTTVIRDSRWRCDHGWDIDLDDGSSNYDIYNNLLLNKGLKLREGFRRHAWNNVMPVGWFHPHVWFLRSNDEVYANIFSNRHSPARMSTPYNAGKTMVDRNLFATDDQKTLDYSARLGWDENSLLGDPMYVDPANGDFRVKEGSPAFKLGFKNFPMDQFGVKKPSLKSIARTPEIPSLKSKGKPTRKQPPLAKEVRRVWQGAILKDLSGEDFSAYGVSKEEGGVAIMDVPQNSIAAKAGLLSGDLIQGINAKPVSNLKSFLRKVSRNADKVLKLKVIRDQKEMELEIQPASKTLIETSATAEGFKTIEPPFVSDHHVTANGKTSNESLATLTDGKLVKNFGAVFPNGVVTGAYKMDLGTSQVVTAINSWAFNSNGRRAAQQMTLFGSDAAEDPGWDLKKNFQAIGSFDSGPVDDDFSAISFRATQGKTLGSFRWIVWALSPVDDKGLFENSAIQELSVETLHTSGKEKFASLPGEVTDFHGYESHRFKTSSGADVEVICPKKAAVGKPWLWRSLFWKGVKPVYQADLKLVEEGYHVVLVHGDVAGHPKGNANIDAAYKMLTHQYGFAKTVSLGSISRGTLSLFRWAAANPEKVNSIYVDNGVCNINSWPAGKQVPGSGSQADGAPRSWENFKKTFGYTTDAEALNSKQSPIDQLEPLAKAGVPILMVCGSKDTAVPYEENDAILAQRYRDLGGSIKVIVQDKGHTHGMKDPTPVINFIKTHSETHSDPQGQPSTVATQDIANKKPNVVFLMTDDQRWDTFGCYGRPEFRTENIDKLSRDGVTFDNAYYAVAICMPSRTTMMTGRYISDHQVGFTCPYDRTLTEAEFADSYPAQMKAAGYRTGFVGKFGIRAEDIKNTMPKYFDFFAVGGMRWPKDDAVLKNIYRRDRPKTDRTIKKGDAMIRFLETQPKDQPFCLSISFDAVKNDRDHDMFAPHVAEFKDKQMSVPGNWVEGKSDRLPPLLDYWRGTYLHVARSSTPPQYQKLARRFATQGFTVDLQVGRLMKKLKEMGVLENTIVIYTSDNGRFHGSQGLFDKAILYEESVKEPLIVFDGRAPKKQAGKRVDAFVSSADMAPTILSLAGLAVPKSMKGHSFTGLLNGTQDMSKWQTAVLLESLFLQDMHAAKVRKHPDLPGLNQQIIANNQSYRCRGVRSGKWKYFIYYEHNPPIEELYDLAADPLEQNNLAGSPTYENVIDDLRVETETLYLNATQ